MTFLEVLINNLRLLLVFGVLLALQTIEEYKNISYESQLQWLVNVE